MEKALTIEELQVFYDYLCVLTVHSFAENGRLLEIVGKALETANRDDPKAKALARLAAIGGLAA